MTINHYLSLNLVKIIATNKALTAATITYALNGIIHNQ